MSEMVERVARAIAENSPLISGPWDDDVNKWERFSPHQQHNFMKQASAAIEEMLEPTKEMIAAGAQKPTINPDERLGTADCDVNAINPTGESGRPNHFATMLRYQAMLREALK